MTFPLVREMTHGAQDTARLIASRWRGTPARAHGLILLAFIAAMAALFSAANMGSALMAMADQDISPTASRFAQAWLTSLQVNELGEIGAIALGGALIAAVFAPFTGTATLSVVPVEDLGSIRPARLHRYFDALAVNAVSGIGLIQLFALTGIASVLTIERDKSPAILVAWGTWVALVFLTTALAWSLEWVVRRYGKGTRNALLVVAVAGLVGFVVRDPFAARGVFGLGDAYSRLIKSLGPLADAFPFLALTAVACVALALTGAAAARAALNLPAHVPAAPRRRRSRAPRTVTGQVAHLLLSTITRTPELRKPILALVGLGVPVMVFTTIDDNVLVTLVLAVSLAISLAWGVNVMGVLGQGCTWLSSQPRLIGRVPAVATVIHATLVLGAFTLLIAVAWSRGNATVDIVRSGMLAATVAATLSATISIRLAVTRPIRARLSGQGDSLVPPLTALAYLGLLLVFAAAPAAFIALGVGSPMYWPMFAACLLASAALAYLNERIWRDPARRARTVATVASN